MEISSKIPLHTTFLLVIKVKKIICWSFLYLSSSHIFDFTIINIIPWRMVNVDIVDGWTHFTAHVQPLVWSIATYLSSVLPRRLKRLPDITTYMMSANCPADTTDVAFSSFWTHPIENSFPWPWCRMIVVDNSTVQY